MPFGSPQSPAFGAIAVVRPFPLESRRTRPGVRHRDASVTYVPQRTLLEKRHRLDLRQLGYEHAPEDAAVLRQVEAVASQRRASGPDCPRRSRSRSPQADRRLLHATCGPRRSKVRAAGADRRQRRPSHLRLLLPRRVEARRGRAGTRSPRPRRSPPRLRGPRRTCRTQSGQPRSRQSSAQERSDDAGRLPCRRHGRQALSPAREIGGREGVAGPGRVDRDRPGADLLRSGPCSTRASRVRRT